MKLTRRSVIQGMAAAPLLAQPRNAPPNLMLVLSDDHSVPYLGAYGARYMSTPVLDAFAGTGMRFNRHFCTAPQCVPSRTGFLTGRSPVAVRMGRFSSPLPPDIVTLPDVLRPLGYYTGICGRYFHLDGVVKPGPMTQAVYEKHGVKTFKNRVDYLDVSPQLQTPAKLTEFLGKVPKGRPWFFWMNYSDPHHPWDKGAGQVDPARIQLPVHLPDLPGVRDDLAAYCGEVERMDGLFGESMEILRRNGLEENTLVIFIGDNGMAFPHGKGSLYDPGLNTPLLVRWPKRVKAGEVTQSLISGEDITPTFIETAGGKVPKEMSGHSFLGLLTGGSYQPREYVFGARLPHGNSPFTPQTKSSTFDLSRCVRSDKWKLIYNCTPCMEYQPVDSARDPGWQQIVAAHKEGKLKPEHERAYFQSPRPVLELFDLEKDPGELNNLAGRADLGDIQRQLLMPLQEKMITDYDFLPLPTNE